MDRSDDDRVKIFMKAAAISPTTGEAVSKPLTVVATAKRHIHQFVWPLVFLGIISEQERIRVQKMLW